MEVSLVRKRLQAAIGAARDRAQRRRQRTAEAEAAYDNFLAHVATPLAKQIANTLASEGYAFTVSTPGRGLRLSLDRGRDDFIELALDNSGDEPIVLGRSRRTRGSRTFEDERPVKAATAPQHLGEEDLLDFFATALEPWLER